jgi:histidyl-tRNA synthetase
MANKLQPIKGFRDFYPQDWSFQNWLKEKWLNLGQSYGYQEYEGPILERLELYQSKTSRELIEKQTFKFNDNDKNYVLRPELTPTLARMIAQKQYQIQLPAKWQSYGRFFRYESPQKGRGRSFFQWNIDLLGLNKIQADIEIIKLACLALKTLGLTSKEVKIKINDRKFLEKSIDKKFYPYIDKLDKMTETEWKKWLKEENINESKADELLALVKNNDYSDSMRLTAILNQMEKQGLSEYIEFDKSLVRGLDYYTGTVFEAWSTGSSLNRALFGGGRYDNLTQQVGGRKKISGVGFAVGDMPIYELLKELNKLPNLSSTPTKILVTIFSPQLAEESIQAAQKLRKKNINTELYLDPDERLDKQLAYANKKNIPWVAVIGPDEAKNNTVTLKNMKSGKQEKLTQKKAVQKLTSPQN